MKRLMSFLFTVAIIAALASPSLAAEAKFSGYYEIKGFATDNVDLDNSVDDNASNTEHELRLSIDITEGPVMARLQINSGAYDWGEPQDSTAWNRELFLVFPVGGASIKVGKSWEEHPFKGIMYIDVQEGIHITYPVGNISLVASIISMDDASSINDNFLSLIGTYAPEGSAVNGSVGLYRRIANDSSTAGTYIKDRPNYLAGEVNISNEPWTISITGAYMFGDKDITTGGVAASYDYKAYAFDIRAGYDFAKPYNLPLTLELIYGLGSGDDNASDRYFKSFTGISPGYFHGAIFKDVGDPRVGGAPEVLNHTGIEANGLGNQRMLALNLSYQATDDLSFGLFGGMFWLTKKNGVNLNDPSGGVNYLNSKLGNELAITTDYSLAKDLTLHLQAAWFMGDDGMYTSTSASTPGDTASEYLVMIGWEF